MLVWWCNNNESRTKQMVSLWPKPAGLPLPAINARLRTAARSPDTGPDAVTVKSLSLWFITQWKIIRLIFFYFIKTVSDTCNWLPSKFPLRTNCISHFMLALKATNFPKGQTCHLHYHLSSAECWSSSTLICRDFTPLVQRHMETSVSFWLLTTSFRWKGVASHCLSLVVWTHHKSDSSTFIFLR